ncbi:hypothetical protein V5N11_022774 [Cardamine amara subsp. amara]|uniref:Phorbol-ester/DAG-type domain-containing protein n=1 Tax=Cardamine amara subsp. amara TaxID=228776 RepID=A0ABD1AX94_CARAN
MDTEEVKLFFHDHPVTPLKDRRRGDCCGIEFDAIYDGYYCSECDKFFHKKCINSPEKIKLLSHNNCRGDLELSENYIPGGRCELCMQEMKTGITIYCCFKCFTCPQCAIHLDCAKYPPPEVIQVPQNHDHKLKLARDDAKLLHLLYLWK